MAVCRFIKKKTQNLLILSLFMVEISGIEPLAS